MAENPLSGQSVAGYAKALGDILGSRGFQSGNTTTTGTTKETGTGRRSSYLDIEAEGVNKILQDILGGTQGLAQVFNQENVSGLYNSSVSAQASGDIVTKLAGEIAKLQARSVEEEERDFTTTVKSKTKQEAESGDEGLLGTVGKGWFDGDPNTGGTTGRIIGGIGKALSF